MSIRYLRMVVKVDRGSESGKLESLASSLQVRTAATDRRGPQQPPELLDWFGDTVLAP